jgi:hypothetical protein
LSSPHREALNQRNKKVQIKKVQKSPRTPPPPPRKKYFPGEFFGNAQKRTKKKKEEEGAYLLFLRAGADVRQFPVLFFLPPLA